jgi:LysR family glycine cleavage system transcriptional activator
LLNKKKMIKQPLDLATFPLLHDADYKGWENWLNQEDAVSVNAHRGTIIDDTNVLIQAALDGQGVALGSSSFVADHIQSGRLVRLFDHELVSSNAYHFVCPPANLKQPAVKAFHQWLLTHVA